MTMTAASPLVYEQDLTMKTMTSSEILNAFDPSVVRRFWKKVTKSVDGCWEWNAYRNRTGYGRFRITTSRPMTYAHRISYIFHCGEIPAGAFICHNIWKRKWRKLGDFPKVGRMPEALLSREKEYRELGSHVLRSARPHRYMSAEQRAKSAESKRKTYALSKESSICVQCGKKNDLLGRSRCSACNENARLRRDRIKSQGAG